MVSATLQVVPCGHQAGQSRFSTAHDENPWLSPIAPWRNNLTALSQCRNLYFVAFRDQISVFEPLFPSQTVPKEPVGVIEYPESRPGLHGYIDPTTPKAVNYLVVRNLGEEEVLLLACDNGDVIGFTTRAIDKSVQECRVTSDPSKKCVIAPFFQENVGASAWGLDVHSAERIIAVSSNTHKIIIFAFAIERPEEESHEGNAFLDPQEDEAIEFNKSEDCPKSAKLSSYWKLPTENNDYSQRNYINFAWSLDGHDENIPAVAFLNAELPDDQGIYLASVDIGGRTILWEVWSTLERLFVQSNARGWAVACVNFSHTRKTSTEIETYGCEPKLGKNDKSVAFVNNTECVQRLSDNSGLHPAVRKLQRTQPEEWLAIQTQAASPPGSPYSDLSEASSEPETQADMFIEGSEHDLQEAQSLGQRSNDDEDRCQRNELPCGVFLTTEYNIQLIVNGNSSQSWSNVLCSNLLHQRLPPEMQPLHRIDRLNMSHQIPELGILLVATQVGRIGIITPTYRPGHGDYGFKLDITLPLESQEDEDLRPEWPLLGFAASPVQGYGPRAYSPSDPPEIDTADARIIPKFRLLMYYYDHTVLSYEISRPIDGGSELLIL